MKILYFIYAILLIITSILFTREFVSTLTNLPDVDWDGQIDSFNLPEEVKKDLKEAMHNYLKKMRSPKQIVMIEDD